MPRRHVWLRRLAPAHALLGASAWCWDAHAASERTPARAEKPALAANTSAAKPPRRTQPPQRTGSPPATGTEANRRPTFFARSYNLAVGQRGQLKFVALDPEGEALHYTLSPVPRGASFDAASGVLSWRPDETQVGTHRLTVTVSDGRSRAQASFEVRVDTPWEDAWGSLFQPAFVANVYVPRERRYGSFVGGGLSVALASWIHRTPEPGPAHGQLYVAASLLQSQRRDTPVLFSYAAGVALSVEKNPSRRWLIPLYGAEFGGLLHKDWGQPFLAMPFIGAYLYAVPAISASLSMGYAFVPTRFDELNGVRGNLRLDVSLW